jgi:hypothetical protein
MRNAILILTALLSAPILWAQEDTFRLNVLGYQWTTSHKTLTFSWPGSANTSCNGSTNINGSISAGGNFSANGTTSGTCSTSYTPPSNQSIDIQKPVVFILAETESARMLLTCSRSVRWSQCHALNPGAFLGRNDQGHFEVQALLAKGKEEWVKFDVVQQTAIAKEAPQTPQASQAPAQEAPVSIEAPKSETAASAGFPPRWKSMTSGTIRTLRFEGDYIYGETIVPESAAKAGVFSLMDVKKDGDKYAGKVNWRILSGPGGKSCSGTSPIEITLVTAERIEGRSFTTQNDAKVDWSTCAFSPPQDWRPFTWIPIR